MFLSLLLLCSACQVMDASPRQKGPWTIPVVVVKYFPVKGDRIDIEVTGDWGEPLDATRAKVAEANAETLQVLEAGTRYHGYKDAKAEPSLRYQVLETYEFLEGLPTYEDEDFDVPVTDYKAILSRIDARSWVEERGAKEIWIWAYHGGKVVLWESNMSSPHGDVSNSNRDADDLPIFDRTFTVYHYNYQRSAHEAVHNHFHQFEHLLNHIDGRHLQPEDRWQELLFWGKFVGSDISHKLIDPGVGWCHYPPNAENDYDYKNPRHVETDAEDWNPQRTGKRQRMNCEHWDSDDMKFYQWWFQNLPGAGHGLQYEGRPLHNWWLFVGDWDYAVENKLTLTKGASTAK